MTKPTTRKLSPWIQLVTKIFNENKHKPGYTFKDAIKDAKKVYKKTTVATSNKKGVATVSNKKGVAAISKKKKAKLSMQAGAGAELENSDATTPPEDSSVTAPAADTTTPPPTNDVPATEQVGQGNTPKNNKNKKKNASSSSWSNFFRSKK